MTAQGSLYSQFKRALKRQNFMLAWTVAAELPKVQLADGLVPLLHRSGSGAGADRELVDAWFSSNPGVSKATTGAPP